MRLLHYSLKPLIEIYSVTQDNPAGFGKPAGFWFSIEGENDWLQWCQAEGFGLDNLKYVTEITLQSDAHILHLKNAPDIDAFDQQYGKKNQKYSGDRIDWGLVAKDYQGIIIAPYCWERRLDLLWYYGWDCASGCIWDAAAVATITSSKVCEELCHDGERK